MTKRSIRELRLYGMVESVRNDPYIKAVSSLIDESALKEAEAKTLRTTCPRCNGPRTVDPGSFTGDCDECYREIRAARAFKNKGRPGLYTYLPGATVDVMSGICRYVAGRSLFEYNKHRDDWTYLGKGREHPVSVVLGMTPPLKVRYVLDGKHVSMEAFVKAFHKPSKLWVFRKNLEIDMRAFFRELKWWAITILTLGNSVSYKCGYDDGYEEGIYDNDQQ